MSPPLSADSGYRGCTIAHFGCTRASSYYMSTMALLYKLRIMVDPEKIYHFNYWALRPMP